MSPVDEARFRKTAAIEVAIAAGWAAGFFLLGVAFHASGVWR